MKKEIFLIIIFSWIMANESKYILKVFNSQMKFDEGFLYKKLENESFSRPIAFKNFAYDFLYELCQELNYLFFHATSYPKKINLNENETFLTVTCDFLFCDV